jgi:hypothetical protein
LPLHQRHKAAESVLKWKFRLHNKPKAVVHPGQYANGP